MSSAIWQKPTLGNVAMVYIYTLPHCQMGYGFEIFHCIYLIYSVLHFSIFSKYPLPKGALLAMFLKASKAPPHGAKNSQNNFTCKGLSFRAMGLIPLDRLRLLIDQVNQSLQVITIKNCICRYFDPICLRMCWIIKKGRFVAAFDLSVRFTVVIVQVKKILKFRFVNH